MALLAFWLIYPCSNIFLVTISSLGHNQTLYLSLCVVRYRVLVLWLGKRSGYTTSSTLFRIEHPVPIGLYMVIYLYMLCSRAGNGAVCRY